MLVKFSEENPPANMRLTRGETRDLHEKKQGTYRRGNRKTYTRGNKGLSRGETKNLHEADRELTRGKQMLALSYGNVATRQKHKRMHSDYQQSR